MNKHVVKVKESLESDAHFFEKCDAVTEFMKHWGFTERDTATRLGVSKSEVHRMNRVSRTPIEIREAAIQNGTQFYAIYRLLSAPRNQHFELRKKIISGEIKTHKEAQAFLHVPKSPRARVIKAEILRLEKRLSFLKNNQEKAG